MKFLGIIPARYESTRFPGKPLVKIGGKTMIQRVYEQARKALDDVIVATDDERIMTEVNRFGGNAVMTSPDHRCGTDRCAEVIENFPDTNNLVVINIQGDEPFIDPDNISILMTELMLYDEISTLVCDLSYIYNNCVKVTRNGDFAEKFSRNFIEGSWNFKHIGIYGYTAAVLKSLAKLNQSENKYDLEQVRWMDAGYKISHLNHPCTKWARESIDNYCWLMRLTMYLHEEWKVRYKHPPSKLHKAYDVILKLPKPILPEIGLTPFVQAMPDKYKSDDVVKSYREYYRKEKVGFATWKNREVPKWF